MMFLKELYCDRKIILKSIEKIKIQHLLILLVLGGISNLLINKKKKNHQMK